MSRLVLVAAAAATLALACRSGSPSRPISPDSLMTTGERSGWTRTGRYDEAVTLCRDFAAAYAGVRCEDIGTTLQGRNIVALHLMRAPGKPTIYVQAGVHAGEIEGKDAGFWFLRDLLDGKVAPGALDAVNVVFVPCINPDGHERFGPNNRPNQRGPEEMGFRTNGVRMNINRDFMKADSAEIAAVLGVYRQHDPLVFVDLHSTDGAKFEHDIAVLLAPVAARADRLDDTANDLSTQLQARLAALGHLPLAFYPSFERADEPESGFSIAEAAPRFSQSYAAVRSRIGVLVETHSWRTYKERAQSTYHTLQALFERAATDAPAWKAAATEADAADQTLRGGELVLDFKNGSHITQLDFRGYAYEKRTSEISGAPWIVYDETKPQIWQVPLQDEVVPALTTRVPAEGYIVDGGFAALIAPVLDRHGIAYARIAGTPKVAVDVFRATKTGFSAVPYEGRQRVTVEGDWARETRLLDRGAIFVSLRQRKPRLIVHLLDPKGPDSFVQWGFVTTAFERKEYMEAYVAEQIARDQLAADPALRAQFDAALAADPELANSAAKRLEWFYRLHPSWDERVDLVPIYRADREPQLAR